MFPRLFQEETVKKNELCTDVSEGPFNKKGKEKWTFSKICKSSTSTFLGPLYGDTFASILHIRAFAKAV